TVSLRPIVNRPPAPSHRPRSASRTMRFSGQTSPDPAERQLPVAPRKLQPSPTYLTAFGRFTQIRPVTPLDLKKPGKTAQISSSPPRPNSCGRPRTALAGCPLDTRENGRDNDELASLVLTTQASD